VRRQGIDYITPQPCFVVPVHVVYAVGFGTNRMVFISADNTNLVACTKSSQMCNNEVRITERGFIFIGACNSPYNRVGERCEPNFKKLPLFLPSFFNLSSCSSLFFLKVHY